MTWQPIRTAPTDGTEVDLWIDDNHGGDGGRHADMKYLAGDVAQANDWHHEMYCLIGDRIIDDLEQVTHWMPKPSAPTSD